MLDADQQVPVYNNINGEPRLLVHNVKDSAINQKLLKYEEKVSQTQHYTR